MNKYEQEIRKSKKSEEYFKEFKKKFPSMRNTSSEELFVAYYRGMQVWLLPPAIQGYFLWAAVCLGKVRAIKILQKTLKVETDGVMGPITRNFISESNTEDFLDQTRTIKNRIILLWRYTRETRN
jgi:lysozyme family protein